MNPTKPPVCHTKPKTRLAALLLAAGSLLAACGSSAQASAKTPQPSLGTIKPGEMIVAIRSGDKPASYVSNGHAAGYEIDQLRAIGTRPGRWCTGPPDAVAVAGCGGAGFGGPPLGTATA